MRWPVLLFCAALLPAASRAQDRAERILHFDSQIAVQTNGALAVTETIQVYAAGGQIKHGIYRDFPQLYHAQSGWRTKTGFVIQNVRRDGLPEDYHLAGRENGTRVYLGSAGTQVPTGVHTYELEYTTDRQLGFFKDHDELYWNVTGNGWIFPMETVTATVTLPAAATATNLTAYTGAQGERRRDFTATHFANTASFATTQPLPAEAGLTIVVEWPKGIVQPPSVAASLWYFFRDNLNAVIAIGGWLLVVAYFYGAWYRVGRDPRRGVIIPLYEPPADFSPAAVRYLCQMGYDNRVFAVTVLNLAVKGVLTIHQTKAWFEGKTFQLVPAKRVTAQLSAEDEIIRRELVGDGMPLTLKKENYATLQAARQKLRDQLAESQQGIFFKNNFGWSLAGLCLSIFFIVLAVLCSDEADVAAVAFIGFTLGGAVVSYAWRARWVVGVLLGLGGLFAGWFVLQLGVVPLWLVVTAAAYGWLNELFVFLLKAPTPQGRQVLDQIEGFKQYLKVAEKDRLNLENPPERTPELFEMFLPYALALGVEQQWSESFAAALAAAGQGTGQAAYAPVWYHGDSWNNIGAASFATALGGSLAGAISSASTAPGSSSGGGSGGGGGGGGSSGGGGGGGGGGGW